MRERSPGQEGFRWPGHCALRRGPISAQQDCTLRWKQGTQHQHPVPTARQRPYRSRFPPDLFVHVTVVRESVPAVHGRQIVALL